jgi:flagellar biosynthesis/type III secretory pathway ATPase
VSALLVNAMTKESTKIVLHSSVPKLPALIERAGEGAACRFVEFFTVNIRNKNTRAAYGQAAGILSKDRQCLQKQSY